VILQRRCTITIWTYEANKSLRFRWLILGRVTRLYQPQCQSNFVDAFEVSVWFDLHEGVVYRYLYVLKLLTFDWNTNLYKLGGYSLNSVDDRRANDCHLWIFVKEVRMSVKCTSCKGSNKRNKCTLDVI